MLSGTQSRSQVDDLFHVCLAYGAASVNSRMDYGTLSRQHIGLSARDIAVDCIANLFRPDDSGNFPQIRAYFGGVSLDRMSDQEMVTYFLPLIYSKVNDGIFRIYQDVDPELARIIYRIKAVVTALQNFEKVNWLGEPSICPASVDRLFEMPIMDLATLKRGLREYARPTGRIPDLMAALSLFLREEEEYCRIIPIVNVAIAFREIYWEPQTEKLDSSGAERRLLFQDVERIIEEACTHVKAKMKPRYVTRKKGKYIDYYFGAIQEALSHKFMEQKSVDGSLFEYLKKYLPDLKKEVYIRSHKKILEYLMRLSTERAKEKLREMYGS